jgi:hypothetical protein
MPGKKEDEREKSTHLELRDYVAFVIASLQTILLPILVMIVVLILLLVFIHR